MQQRRLFLVQRISEYKWNNSDQDLHLHIVQDTPATVRVSRAQTRSTGSVLLAALHRDTGHLSEKHTHARGYKEEEVSL